MEAERWRQIEQLYHAALDLEPVDREAFLAEASESDEVRQEVSSLLNQSASGSSPLDRPAWEGACPTSDFTQTNHWGLDPGTQVGPYRIEAALGQGGMGIVYRAHDTRLNRPVAIKFLRDNLAGAAAQRRFQRETQMASALNHPHILTVHDTGEFEGRLYLVTELVNGGTLPEWLRKKRTWRETLELLVGVADGLAAAHAAGILHRDVKSANILVSNNGHAKLADFGLAKLAKPSEQIDGLPLDQGHTVTGLIIGTVAYLSPEQASGRVIDARSDIFSFGVVLYEAFAGRRPFRGADDREVVQNILRTRPDSLLRDLPAELWAAIEKALEKDPEERYQSMRELVVDLKRVLRLSQSEMSAARSPRKAAIGRRLLAIGTTALFIGVLCATWLLREHDYFWRNPLDGARIERLTDFEGDELDAAISPDGKLMTFLSDRDGRFDAWVGQIVTGDFVNITKGRFPTVDPAPIRRVGFTADGARVWFLNGNGKAVPYTAWLASAMGGAPQPFVNRCMEYASSPDGSRIVYHTDDPGDPIFIADANGSNSRRIFVEKPGGHCHHLVWSPDSRYIYFVKGVPTTAEMDIWRVSASATAGPERITYHNARVAYPAWLDDHTVIYSATAEDGSGQWLYTIDPSRGIQHRVSSGIGEEYLSVGVSATGLRRLICSVATPSASLWTVPISERIQTDASVARLSVPNARARAPRAGSGYLLFLSSHGGPDGIWKFENDAATELWKGKNGGVVAPAAVSPDGTQICFSYRKQGRSGMYLMNSEGTNIRPLAPSLEVRSAASWSPDGKWVAVAASENERARVFLVPVDGGSPVRLVDTPSYNPLWSPDGQLILYSQPVKGSQMVVKAITPNKAPVPIPEIVVPYTAAIPYRFIPGRKELIFTKDGSSAPARGAGFRNWNFYWIDLVTRRERQITDLKPGYLMQSFDISPDGRQIIFDRLRDNSNIVLMDLAH